MEELKDLLVEIPSDFGQEAKVWIFNTEKPLNESEEKYILHEMNEFQKEWKSHGSPVHSWIKLLGSDAIIIVAEPEDDRVSGCSTDSMMQKLKSISEKLKVDFFNPQVLLFIKKGEFHRVPISQLQYAVNQGFLGLDDLFLDASIDKIEDLRNKYILPIGHSWLMKRIKLN